MTIKIFEFTVSVKPFQADLVVCQKLGKEVDMTNVEDQEFIVVQYFDKLEENVHMNVLVYIINTTNAALIHYANCRANDIASKW